MEQKVPSAFVSYRRDSKEHEKWVHSFVNTLRDQGIDANFERFLTQEKTVNLYQMMIEGIRDNDYVIVVLTENYAKRSDSFTAGVGFETLQTLPLLQQNLSKLIFVVRYQGDFRKAIPFHLQGYHAIDFSKDEDFEERMVELVHRIYKEPLLEKAPLGPRPNMQPRPSDQRSNSNTKQQTRPRLRFDEDVERIVWLLPRGFFWIDDVTFRDDPNWNVKCEFVKYNGQPVYGVHYKPEYHEVWRDYERRFRTLQIPEADWGIDEYFIALRFVQKIREVEENAALKKLVEERREWGHHVFHYEPGEIIYLPEVPEQFKVWYDTGKLRDIRHELENLYKRFSKKKEPVKLLSEADSLRLDLKTAAHQFFKDNELILGSIMDVVNDFDSKGSYEQMLTWVYRSASVLEKALNHVLDDTMVF